MVVEAAVVIVKAVVVVEGVLDVEAGSDVEVGWLVGVDVLAAADDEVDVSVAAPGGKQATTISMPKAVSRIAIP